MTQTKSGIEDATAGIVRGRTYTIPADRYRSGSFATLERERLWPHVWQIACSRDHVAVPGDWFECRSGPHSVVFVRGDDGELRGFQNVCRHRGNPLCQGSGEGRTELRCPFHRWTWNLRGELSEIPSRGWFGPVDNDELPLVPVRVGEWGPLVFFNLDPDAMDLEDFLEGVPADAAWADLDEMHCQVMTTTPVGCNWKVVADGFSETYHVQGIHPEMLGSIDEVNSTQRLWEHHGASYQEYGVPSPRLGRGVTDQQVWDSFVVTQGGRMGPDHTEPGPVPPVPEGRTIRDVIADLIRDHQAGLGVDLSRFDTDGLLTLSQYNLFPNATVLVWGGDMCNVLVARPGPAPDQAELVTFLFHRQGADAPARPMDVDVPLGTDFGTVLNQDIEMLATMQNGIEQPGFEHLTVSGEECRLINTHRNLERYLGISPTEIGGLAEEATE